MIVVWIHVETGVGTNAGRLPSVSASGRTAVPPPLLTLPLGLLLPRLLLPLLILPRFLQPRLLLPCLLLPCLLLPCLRLLLARLDKTSLQISTGPGRRPQHPSRRCSESRLRIKRRIHFQLLSHPLRRARVRNGSGWWGP